MNKLADTLPPHQTQFAIAAQYKDNSHCNGESKIKFIPSLQHGALVESFDLFDVRIYRRTCSSVAEDKAMVGLVNRVYNCQRLDPDVKTAPNSFFILQNKEGKILSCAGCQNAHEANTAFTSIINQGITEENTETESDCYIGPFAAEKGHGYGKVLLAAIEKNIPSHGFKRVVLDVYNAVGMHMHGYYQNLGYRPHSHRLYKLEDGQVVTETRYIKYPGEQ